MRLRVETGRARTYASSKALVAITFGLAVAAAGVLADVHGALRLGHRPVRADRHRRPVRRCAVGPGAARPTGARRLGCWPESSGEADRDAARDGRWPARLPGAGVLLIARGVVGAHGTARGDRCRTAPAPHALTPPATRRDAVVRLLRRSSSTLARSRTWRCASARPTGTSRTGSSGRRSARHPGAALLAAGRRWRRERRAAGWRLVVLARAGRRVAGWFYARLDLRSDAEKARREFRHALAAYLELVTILMAGGAGVETAMFDAAAIGEGPAVPSPPHGAVGRPGPTRTAVAAARRTRRPTRRRRARRAARVDDARR